MKTKVPPLYLTYFMVKWDGVSQIQSDQNCTICGKPLLQTEAMIDEKGVAYEGFVCHSDKQVTWVRKS